MSFKKPELTLFTGAGNASERVIWALRYKGLAYQEIAAGSLPTADYLQLNPLGYVPTLKVGQQPLAESMAIAEYLEELCPAPALFPGEPLQRARIREVCEIVNSTIHPPQNRSVLQFLRPELAGEPLRALRAEWLSRNLASLQPRLWLTGDYAVGQQFSLADIFVAVIFKRALSQGVPAADWPAYCSYLRFLFAQAGVSENAPFALPV